MSRKLKQLTPSSLTLRMALSPLSIHNKHTSMVVLLPYPNQMIQKQITMLQTPHRTTDIDAQFIPIYIYTKLHCVDENYIKLLHNIIGCYYVSYKSSTYTGVCCPLSLVLKLLWDHCRNCLVRTVQHIAALNRWRCCWCPAPTQMSPVLWVWRWTIYCGLILEIALGT